MTDYLTNGTDLTAVADAIREKGGTASALTWPTGYVDAIGAISGSTSKTVTITLGSPMHASEAMTPACIIYEAVDPTSMGAQIGQIETPTGSATVTTSESCIVLDFQTYGALSLGYTLNENGVAPIETAFTGRHSFYVFDSGSVGVDGVDYDD